MKRMLAPIIIYLIAILALSGCSETPEPPGYLHNQPSEYYLYLPEGYNDEENLSVFVGVHGFGGSGKDCLTMWQTYAEKEGFVLICPTLADADSGWYQDEGERKVAKIIKQVSRKYKTNKQVFMVGFSAGAQFVQGYANQYAKSVKGVVVLSAGNYYQLVLDTKNIPYLVIIGDKDDAVSIARAQNFVAKREKNGYEVDHLLLPGVGHTVSKEAKEATMELFREVIKE